MTTLNSDRLPAELLRLLVAARVELDLNTNNNGECAVCHTSFRVSAPRWLTWRSATSRGEPR